MRKSIGTRDDHIRPVSDMRSEGMVHVVTVRSPVSRGMVRSVTVPHLPRGYVAIFPDDIPGENRVRSLGIDVPVLAPGRVSYRGEPCILIAGPDPDRLDDLRRQTIVNVDAEPATLDMEHGSEDKIAATRSVRRGDPDLAFSVAATVVEGEYRVGAQEHCYSEPQGAFCVFDYDKLMVRCATQWPYHVRDSVALVLGVASPAIVVRPTPLGVHLDGKLWYPSLLACHAALAATRCKKPARILLSREEDFLYSPKRARARIIHKTALDPTGAMSAMSVRVLLDVGAYAPLAEELVSRACIDACGAYSVPNVFVEGIAIRTDAPPMGAFAGLGSSQSFFAVETHTDRIARQLGEDPIDWKSRTLLGPDRPFLSGEHPKERNPYQEIAQRVSAMSDFPRKFACYQLIGKRRSAEAEGPFRGIGFAYAYQGAGPFLSGKNSMEYRVVADLDKDLVLTIRASSPVGNRGTEEIWRATASGILDVPLEKVLIGSIDTDEAPDSGPATLSSNIAVLNRLIANACTALSRKRFRFPLPISATSVYRAPKPLRWTKDSVTGMPYDGLAFGAAVVEVELDAWSREPRVLGVWLCVEGGTIVSERHAVRALELGTVDALSQSLYERLDIDLGAASGAEFRRYQTMPLRDMPSVHIEFLPGDKRRAIKGIGELPFDCVPSALVQAVSQAAGLFVDAIPIDGSLCVMKAARS